MKKLKLSVFWPQYRKYNKHFFEILSGDDRFESEITWIRSSREDDQPDHEFISGLNLEVLGMKNIRLLDYNFKSFKKLVKCLYNKIKTTDAVLTSTQNPLHSKVAFILAKILNKKIFICVESWREVNKKNYMKRIYYKIGIFMLKKSDRVFVHGSKQESYLISQGINSKKIYVLPFLSEDLEKLPSSPLDDDLKNMLKGKVVILFFARIVEVKGLRELLLAYSRICCNCDNTFLLICGGIDQNFSNEYSDLVEYEKCCIKIAKNLPNNSYYFVGNVLPQAKKKYFEHADIFVHPVTAKTNEVEGWGLVLNEATSMGLPIISNERVGAVGNLLINNTNGFLFKPDDIDDLENKITILIKNEDKRERFSLASRKIFDAYHIPENINEAIHRSLYEI